MKTQMLIRLGKILLMLGLLLTTFSVQEINTEIYLKTKNFSHKRKPIDSLSQEEIRLFYKKNPCYLPLLKDSSLWEPGTSIGFNYSDLFNTFLPESNKYRNRYLVGDFNVMETDGKNRMISEIYPALASLKEFNRLPANLVKRMENIIYGSPAYKTLINDLKTVLGDSSETYINFLEKVWRYKMIPIKRNFSVEGNYLYYGGQTVNMCEACKDTLKMLGRFAVSAKGRGLGIKHDQFGNDVKYYYEMLPVGDFRFYYAGLNYIASKNWDSQRRYESSDQQRDNELGGGNKLITLYQDKEELPNFLLFEPDKEYPNAMLQNGIHEVSLRIMARGMLGTPNSIGCIRVSDFAAKFLRWWTPQNCKFFIAYDDARYNYKIDLADSIFNYLPFKNQKEGNAFRRWMNENKPFESMILEIDSTGDFRNGYILDAYYYLKDEYEKSLNKINTQQEVSSLKSLINSPLYRVVLIEQY